MPVNYASVRHAQVRTAETSYALKSRGCLASLAKGSDGGVGRAKPKGRSFWTSLAAVLAVAVLVAKPKPELLGATVLVVCPDELSPLYPAVE